MPSTPVLHPQQALHTPPSLTLDMVELNTHSSVLEISRTEVQVQQATEVDLVPLRPSLVQQIQRRSVMLAPPSPFHLPSPVFSLPLGDIRLPTHTEYDAYRATASRSAPVAQTVAASIEASTLMVLDGQYLNARGQLILDEIENAQSTLAEDIAKAKREAGLLDFPDYEGAGYGALPFFEDPCDIRETGVAARRSPHGRRLNLRVTIPTETRPFLDGAAIAVRGEDAPTLEDETALESYEDDADSDIGYSSYVRENGDDDDDLYTLTDGDDEDLYTDSVFQSSTSSPIAIFWPIYWDRPARYPPSPELSPTSVPLRRVAAHEEADRGYDTELREYTVSSDVSDSESDSTRTPDDPTAWDSPQLEAFSPFSPVFNDPWFVDTLANTSAHASPANQGQGLHWAPSTYTALPHIEQPPSRSPYPTCTLRRRGAISERLRTTTIARSAEHPARRYGQRADAVEEGSPAFFRTESWVVRSRSVARTHGRPRASSSTRPSSSSSESDSIRSWVHSRSASRSRSRSRSQSRGRTRTRTPAVNRALTSLTTSTQDAADRDKAQGVGRISIYTSSYIRRRTAELEAILDAQDAAAAAAGSRTGNRSRSGERTYSLSPPESLILESLSPRSTAAPVSRSSPPYSSSPSSSSSSSSDPGSDESNEDEDASTNADEDEIIALHTIPRGRPTVVNIPPSRRVRSQHVSPSQLPRLTRQPCLIGHGEVESWLDAWRAASRDGVAQAGPSWHDAVAAGVEQHHETAEQFKNPASDEDDEGSLYAEPTPPLSRQMRRVEQEEEEEKEVEGEGSEDSGYMADFEDVDFEDVDID